MIGLVIGYELSIAASCPCPRISRWRRGRPPPRLAVAVRLLYVVIWPHVIVGLIEIGAALTIETRPHARYA